MSGGLPAARRQQRSPCASSGLGARDGQHLARLLSALQNPSPAAAWCPAAPLTSLYALPSTSNGAAPPAAVGLDGGLLTNMSGLLLQPPSASAVGGMQPVPGQLLTLDSLAALPLEQALQSGLRPHGLAGLLTPADASLLIAMTQLQQRQAAPGLAASDTRSPRGMRPGRGRHNSIHATSSLYKTELCRSWQQSGSCRYGNKCQFAHGPRELRPIQRHPKYKTQNCRTFALTGSCAYGSRCRFIHAQPRSTPQPPAGLSSALLPHAQTDNLDGHSPAFLRSIGDCFGSAPLEGRPTLGITPEQAPGASLLPGGAQHGLFPLPGLPGSEPLSPCCPLTPPAVPPSLQDCSPLTRSCGSGASVCSSSGTIAGSQRRRLPVFEALAGSLSVLP